MTAPKPQTLEREKEKLYVTEAELYRRLGLDPKIAQPVIASLDRNPRSAFPPKQALWGGRRYWPAVKAWLDRTNGLIPQVGGKGGL